jgi:hypothetical protein
MSHDIGDPSGACTRCGSPTKVFSYDEAPWGFRGNYSWECEKCGRFYQADELDDKGHTVYVFENDGKVPATPLDIVLPEGAYITSMTTSYGENSAMVVEQVPVTFESVLPRIGQIESWEPASKELPKAYEIDLADFQTNVEQANTALTAALGLPALVMQGVSGSERIPQPVDCLYRTYQDVSVERGLPMIIQSRAADTVASGALRGVTVDAAFLDESMAFDEILVGDGKQVVMGIDLALEPSVSGIISAHFVQGVDGRPHLEIDEVTPMPMLDKAEYQLQDSFSEASVTQCICCVAGGDDSKKVCELRTDTGIEEGWWCNECYLGWKNNGQP